jgi:purine-binding chemotaxis protein CheW
METSLRDRSQTTGDIAENDEQQFVALMLGDQLCGIPVLAVRDVLGEQTITRVPLAPREIAGSLNLRGHIVTAIDLRLRLGLPPAPPGTPRMSVVAEDAGELYALLVDRVSEVMSLKARTMEPNPPTLPPPWADLSSGICRLEGRLLVLLDVERLIRLVDPTGR